MTQYKSKKTIMLKYILPGFSVLALLIALFLFLFQSEKRNDYKRLESEVYDSVFLSMYDISRFKEEDFATYRGLDTLIANHKINSLKQLSSYLDKIFASGNNISSVYIGFDPYFTYSKCLKKDEIWRENLETTFFSYFTNHPDTTFEILLPYPSLDTWTDFSDKKSNTALAAYQTVVALISSYDNVICHFAGAEEWLIANPGNYTDAFTVNELISCELIKHVFCDRRYTIDAGNAENIFSGLREMIATQKSTPTKYPDLSGTHIVFFGDSIIGNHNGSFSIPGIISSLTNADVYNYAIGGTSAAAHENEQDIYPSFLKRTNDFLNETIGDTRDNTEFPFDSIPKDSSDICFIIHFGINDFLWNVSPQGNASDTNTFEGALRTGIGALQEAYPNAVIMLVTPNLCTYYAGDTVITNDNGYVFDDYLNTIETVAEDMNITRIDMPSLLNVDETNYTEYYADSFHHTEQGRFITAGHWMDALESQY